MLDTNAISCEYMYEYGHQREGFYKDLGVPWQISIVARLHQRLVFLDTMHRPIHVPGITAK